MSSTPAVGSSSNATELIHRTKPQQANASNAIHTTTPKTLSKGQQQHQHHHLSDETPRSFAWHEFRSVYDTPSWLVNPFQEVGYRVDLSLWQCFLSTFKLHNESWNIWTSWIAALLLVASVSINHLPNIPHNDDYWVFLTSMTLVASANVFSAIFHTFLSHSPRTKKLLASLDYWGLFLIVSGSAIPAVQYGLKCAPNLQWFYWSCAWGNVVLGIPMSFWPLLRDYRVVRIVFFMGELAGSCYAFYQLLSVFPWSHEYIQGYLWPTLSDMVFWVLLATFFFASRIPERWFPRTFDLFFHSHVLWHTVGCIGMLRLFSNLFRVYQYSLTLECPVVA